VDHLPFTSDVCGLPLRHCTRHEGES